MGIDIRINSKSLKSLTEDVFIGAGMGSLGGEALRVVTPAGMVFGMVFSLLRRVDKVVIDALVKLVSLLPIKWSDKIEDLVVLASRAVNYALRGVAAFGLTALVIPSFMPIHALALIAIFGAVDLTSMFVLEHNWMLSNSIKD